jgi:IS30 family transposase
MIYMEATFMKHKRLNIEEREHIAIFIAKGKSYRHIGRILGRSHTTIIREVNLIGKKRKNYRAIAAQKLAEKRNLLSGRKKLVDTMPEVFIEVFERLFKKWSPRQVSEDIKRAHPDEPWTWISHETIYRYVYAFPRGQLKKAMISYLRHKKRLRGGRGKLKMRKQVLEDPTPISQRPEEVKDRKVPGHWEGDLIVGKGNKSAIGTLVERTSRMVFIVPLKAKTAKTVAESFSDVFEEIAPEMKKSLTYDRGTEMAEHKWFSTKTGIPVFFADPHAPWQRGSCENTNMLVRDFFPRGTDFTKVPLERLKEVQNWLNERPRQTLGWKTPKEVFYHLIGATDV